MRSIVALALAVTLSGCVPAIRHFDVTPEVICRGQTIEMSWDVVGWAAIMADPPLPGEPLGRVAKQGTLTLKPEHGVRLDLTVHRDGKTASYHRAVDVQSEAPLQHVVGDSHLDFDLGPARVADGSQVADGRGLHAGCDAKHAWVDIDVAGWDATLRVMRVLTTDGRTYEVEHQGVSAAVVPDAPATAFEGKPLGGGWRIGTPLQIDEACGTPSMPQSLRVIVTTACVEPVVKP